MVEPVFADTKFNRRIGGILRRGRTPRGSEWFERFFRGSSRADRPSGSGLGLTIVRVLARRWGGEATIANRPEGGARAEVRLPRAAAGPDDALLAESKLDRAMTMEA